VKINYFQKKKVKINCYFYSHVIIAVNLPERATISLAVRPLFEKEVRRPLRSNVGAGMLELASLATEVVESLLPN
jgi:hypothetical protein